MIEISTLHELLTCDYEAGTLTWKRRDAHWFARKDRQSWWNNRYANTPAFTHVGNHGYQTGSIAGHVLLAHRVIWAMRYGFWPAEIDHIDGERLNNAIANMRDVSSAENGRNKRVTSANTSGVMGVHWYTRRAVWAAYIGSRKSRRLLGYFVEFDEAVAARKAAEVEHGYHPNHGRAA